MTLPSNMLIQDEENPKYDNISTETEEGQMLKNAFGGIAAMLRFKQQG